jgi:hypothetical protein
MPPTETQKRVRAHQAEQDSPRREFDAQMEKRIERVVRGSGRTGRVGQRNCEPWFISDCQPGHGQSVFKAGGRPLRLERLRAHRCKEHGVQRQSGTRGTRHGQMALVGRVEAAAKEGDTLAGGRGRLHFSIVPLQKWASAAGKALW